MHRLEPEIDGRRPSTPLLPCLLLLASSATCSKSRQIKLHARCQLVGIYAADASDANRHPETGGSLPGAIVQWLVKDVHVFDDPIQCQQGDFKTGTSKILFFKPGCPRAHGSSIAVCLGNLQLQAVLGTERLTWLMPEAIVKRYLPKFISPKLPSADSMVAIEDDSSSDDEGNFWPLNVVIPSVILAGNIKNLDGFDTVLWKTFDLHNALQGNDLVNQYSFKKLPHRTTLQRWCIKMDMMSMLFRRWQFINGHMPAALALRMPCVSCISDARF